MIEHLKDKANWNRATQPRPIRQKRYLMDTDEQPWSTWDILKAVATFAIGSWIAWQVLDVFCGGGAR